MTLVLFLLADKQHRFSGNFRFQRRTGVDRVRHGAHHLRVAAEADRAQARLAPIRFKDDRVRIRAETDRLLGIVVADWH